MSRTKCGVLVHNNVKEAIQLDDYDGDTLWAEAIAKEMNGLDVLNFFNAIILDGALQQTLSVQTLAPMDFCTVQTLALVAFCRPSMAFCMVQTLALASEIH